MNTTNAYRILLIELANKKQHMEQCENVLNEARKRLQEAERVRDACRILASFLFQAEGWSLDYQI